MQLRNLPSVSVWFSGKGEAKSFVACKGNYSMAMMWGRVGTVWKSPREELKSNPAGEMWEGVTQLSVETILSQILSPEKACYSLTPGTSI